MQIFGLYNLIICVVAAALYVVVNETRTKPPPRLCAKDRNRRCSCRGNPRSFDAITGVGGPELIDAYRSTLPTNLRYGSINKGRAYGPGVPTPTQSSAGIGTSAAIRKPFHDVAFDPFILQRAIDPESVEASLLNSRAGTSRPSYRQ
jgi:hypothetical protein